MSDLIERQLAINALRALEKPAPTAQHLSAIYDCEDVITSLPSAQQDLCEYCHEDSDGYVKPVEKNCHAFIRFGMDGWELSLRANGWHGNAKIRYCPMCGRELNHE